MTTSGVDVVFGEVLQAIGSSAAGVELEPLGTGDGEHAFRVRETEDVCIDVVHRDDRWWVCSSSAEAGTRVVDAAWAYPGSGLDSFTPAVVAAAAWDGDGEPAGWDRAMRDGHWRRAHEQQAEELERTEIGEYVVTTVRLAEPHRRSMIGPLVTHEVACRRAADREVLMVRRCLEHDAHEQHQLLAASVGRASVEAAGSVS